MLLIFNLYLLILGLNCKLTNKKVLILFFCFFSHVFGTAINLQVSTNNNSNNLNGSVFFWFYH